jgi:hypothetical protein
MSDLGSLAIFEKLAMSTFQWHRSCGDLSSGHQIAVFRIRASGVISLFAVYFSLSWDAFGEPGQPGCR